MDTAPAGRLCYFYQNEIEKLRGDVPEPATKHLPKLRDENMTESVAETTQRMRH